jgi:hypothetical protein
VSSAKAASEEMDAIETATQTEPKIPRGWIGTDKRVMAATYGVKNMGESGKGRGSSALLRDARGENQSVLP